MTRTSAPSRACSSAINPRARLVDLTHTVPPQDIRRARPAPRGRLAVFPARHGASGGRGSRGRQRPATDRRRAGGHYFVGPDNGLLGFCFDLPGARGVVLADATVPSAAGQPDVPGSGHVRAGGRPLLAGRPAAALGPPLRYPVRLPCPGRGAGGRVDGEVLLVDRFGNLLTNLRGRELPGPAERGVLRIGGARVRGLVGDLRRAAPAGARGRDRQLGPGRGVRAGGERAPAARDRAGRPRQLEGVGVGFGCSAAARSRPRRSSRRARDAVEARRPSRSSPGPRSGPSRRSTSSRPPSPSSGPSEG